MGNALDWVGLEWGPQGGLRAREVVLWAQLQREFRTRGLLPEQAVRRLDTIGFCWDPQASTQNSCLQIRLCHQLSAAGPTLYPRHTILSAEQCGCVCWACHTVQRPPRVQVAAAEKVIKAEGGLAAEPHRVCCRGAMPQMYAGCPALVGCSTPWSARRRCWRSRPRPACGCSSGSPGRPGMCLQTPSVCRRMMRLLSGPRCPLQQPRTSWCGPVTAPSC